jgi:hypothetical protein
MARGVLSLSFGLALAASLSLSHLGCNQSSNGTGGGATCRTNSDCRLFSDYCTGCDCRALPTSAPDPTCPGPGVQCLVDPCDRKSAVCAGGACAVSSP